MVNKKLKILFLLTQDLESPSGVGRYFPLAKELAAIGQEVTIIALHANYCELRKKRFKKNNVLIWYVAQMHVKKIGNKKFYYSSLELLLRIFWATIRMLIAAYSIKSDIIYIAKPHPMNSIAGVFAKVLGRTRYLILDVDDYESASGNFSNILQIRIMEFFEKNIPKIANKVTTNTSFMRSKMISWGVSDEKIEYLPNGVDLERFPTPSNNEVVELKQCLGLGNDKIIGYIGSISLINHPVDILLEAFSEILKTRSDVILLLVGAGEDFEKIINLSKKLHIASKVRAVGRISPERIYLYYHICTVTVDPVKDNDACKARFPLKIIESIVCGVPVVTSDVGDRAEILGNLKNKFLSSSTNKNSLSKKLIEVIESENLYDITENACFKHKFSWKNISENFYKIIAREQRFI